MVLTRQIMRLLQYFCATVLAISLSSQPLYAQPLIGYYKSSNVEWIWVNGTRFDLNLCDDKIRLKEFVAKGRHTMDSPVSMPSGYITLNQVTLEAVAEGMQCSTFQEFKKWLNR